MTVPVARCLFCGGDRTDPRHLQWCDGRQGELEARIETAPAPEPEPARRPNRYERALAIYRETSREAWESVAALLPAVDARIVRVIEEQCGATCDEVEVATSMSHQTVSAEIRHMYEAGLLTEVGICRPTRSGRSALVWFSTTKQWRKGA